MMQKYAQCKKSIFLQFHIVLPLQIIFHLIKINHKLPFIFSEIGKVRGNLFQINGKKNEPLVLPDAAGPSISLSEKVYVPIKEFPDVRILCHIFFTISNNLLCLF